MLLFSFILVPVVLAASSELKINDYVVNIDENTLKSIHKSQDSASNELDLSNLGLRAIDNNVFDNMEHLRTLNLANNSLKELPDLLFVNLTNLEHLSLADNKILGLSKNFVGLNNLKTLNISNNEIFYYRKYNFFGLTKSCDIFISEAPYSISSKVFANPFLQNDADPVNTPYIGRTSGYPIPRQNENRIKICIQEGSVQLLDHLKENETLESHCREVQNRWGSMDLESLSISKFESGWYNLQDLPIDNILLRKNNIVRVSGELLNGLPKSVTKVELTSNKIERLEKDVIENEHLQYLDLAGNAISEIEAGALEKTKISTLILVNNRLKSLKFVETLPSTIIDLRLSSNQITEVTPGVFAKLDKLKNLEMEENNISELKSHSFRGLSNLVDISLQRNHLKKIEPGAFQDLKSVDLLKLNDNDLDVLDKGVFAGLDNLNGIDLGDNKLKQITNGLWDDLRNDLEIIDLSNNHIERLESGAFANMSIGSLFLRRNKISKIEKRSFVSASFKTLSLSENQLKQLDGESFEGIKAIGNLVLDNNGITKIEKGTMKHLSLTKSLVLRENPIKRLENGAFFGIPESPEIEIDVLHCPLEVIQGGLFEDV